MNKLSRVRKALKDNPEIEIVRSIEDIFLPPKNFPYRRWSHTVEILIAPIETIFNINDLQEMMNSLIKDPKESSMDCFEETETIIRFGTLYYDEVIGLKKTTEDISITDKDIILNAGINVGSYQIIKEEELKRRILVTLVPTIQLTKKVLENPYFIYKKDLQKIIS